MRQKSFQNEFEHYLKRLVDIIIFCSFLDIFDLHKQIFKTLKKIIKALLIYKFAILDFF